MSRFLTAETPLDIAATLFGAAFLLLCADWLADLIMGAM